MNNPISDAAKSSKSLAQAIAKQMAREPSEILRDVKEQTIEKTLGQPQGPQEFQNSDDQQRQIENQNQLQDKIKSNRRMRGLQNEIADIHKQNVFKDLQSRISQGESLPLEEYPELSVDQRQVLKAQMEAVRNRAIVANQGNLQEVPVIRSKPSRRFGAGQKQEAEKQQTRIEKPVPPSG